MTKYAKNLIIAASAAVVLSGVMLALIMTSNDETDKTETILTTQIEPDTERISDFFESLSYDMITSIDVKNENDEYTLTVDDESVSVKGYNGYRFDSVMIDSIPENAFNATIFSKPTGTDLSVYGLDAPRGEFTLNFNGGEKINVKIGDVSPIASDVYISIDGKPYTVSSYLMQPFLADKKYYFSKEIYQNKETDEEKILERMYIENEHGELDIINRRDLHAEKAYTFYNYMMVKPISATLNRAYIDTPLKSIYGLYADEVWSINTELDSEPIAIADFYFRQEDTESEKMLIWKQDSEELKYLVKFGSDPVIYGFEDDSRLPWLTLKGESIVSTYTINEMYIWDYESLTVETGDNKLTFNCSGTGNQETFMVFLDGLGYDLTKFQKYNSFLLKGYISEGNFTASRGNLIAKITIKMNFGEVYTLEYYESADNALASIAVVNGETIGTLRKAYTDVLLQNTEIIRSLSDEELVNVW